MWCWGGEPGAQRGGGGHIMKEKTHKSNDIHYKSVSDHPVYMILYPIITCRTPKMTLNWSICTYKIEIHNTCEQITCKRSDKLNKTVSDHPVYMI